jgi:hypothetical protein
MLFSTELRGRGRGCSRHQATLIDSSIQHRGPGSNASGVASARPWTLSVLGSGYGAHTLPVIGSAVAALFA